MKDNLLGLLNKARPFVRNNISVVVVINLLLAFVAVFRDIFTASYLGTSAEADALLLANFVPDSLGNNLLAISIIAACVPVFSKLYAQNQLRRFKECLSVVTIMFLLVSLGIFMGFLLFKSEVIRNLGPGLSAQTSILSLKLYTTLLPCIILFAIFAIGSALLQVHNRFNIPALAPVFYNAVFLCGVIMVSFFGIPIAQGVYLIACTIVVSVFAMTALVWGSLFKDRVSLFALPQEQVLFDLNSPLYGDIKQILLTFIPFLFIAISTQSIMLIERYLASNMEIGSIAGLNYAFRLAQFPIWVFVAAVSMIILPSMSKAKGLGNEQEFKTLLFDSLRLVLIITVPMSIILYTLRTSIVSILLQRGVFDHYSLRITAGILAGFALAIVGQALVYTLLRVYLAMGKMGPPLISGIFSAFLNIILDFYLVKLMGSAGLGYGAAAGAACNAAILLLLLSRELQLSLYKRVKEVMKIITANIPVIFICLLCNLLWGSIAPEATFIIKAFYVIFVVFSTSLAYLVGLRRLKII